MGAAAGAAPDNTVLGPRVTASSPTVTPRPQPQAGTASWDICPPMEACCWCPRGVWGGPMGTGGRRGRGCVAPTLCPGRQVLRPSKGLPSPPRIPAHRSTPRLHERPLPLPRAAPPLPRAAPPHFRGRPPPLPRAAPAPCTAWAGQVTAASSPDRHMSGPCLTGLLSDHSWLEPPRRSEWPLWDPGALEAENGTRGLVGVVTRRGRGRSSGAVALS